jgi:hypothetical protein
MMIGRTAARSGTRAAAKAALLTTGAVAALVLAGCNGGQSTAGGTPSGTGLSTASFSPVPSTTIAPAPSAVTQPAPAVTTAPEAASGGSTGGGSTGGGSESAALRECKPANLKLSLGQSDGTAGTVFVALRFTNVSKVSCVMVGWPGVSYVTGDSGTQVGKPAAREGAKGAQVTLRPGQVASSVVGMTDVGVFDPGQCKPTATRGLRVYPPDSTASMFVANSGRGCAGNPPSPQLRVETVKPGGGNA